MSDAYAPDHEERALTPSAIRLRNSCLGALSRRSALRPPSAGELAKVRNDLGLRDAWRWWSSLDTPTEAVLAIPRVAARRPPRVAWRVIVAILTTGAWLIVPAAVLALVRLRA